MKRSLKVFLLFVNVVFVCVFFTLPLQAAVITGFEGGVQVRSASDKSWSKAKKGMAVGIGDSIQTARNSVADVSLDAAGKNVIRIEENTLVVINSANAADIDRLDLSYGKIYASVEEVKADLGFEVKTPSAVAGVRGTGWSVDSGPKKDEISTFKDAVFVKSFDAQGNLIDEITVPEGFKALVDRFEKAGELMKLTDDEIDRFNAIRQSRGSDSRLNENIERTFTLASEMQINTNDLMDKIMDNAEIRKAEDIIRKRIEDYEDEIEDYLNEHNIELP